MLDDFRRANPGCREVVSVHRGAIRYTDWRRSPHNLSQASNRIGSIFCGRSCRELYQTPIAA
jgi:hypothetical protein